MHKILRVKEQTQSYKAHVVIVNLFHFYLFILAINPTPPKAYRRKRITQGFRVSRTCRSVSKIK